MQVGTAPVSRTKTMARFLIASSLLWGLAACGTGSRPTTVAETPAPAAGSALMPAVVPTTLVDTDPTSATAPADASETSAVPVAAAEPDAYVLPDAGTLLSTPIPPPIDDEADEPVVELGSIEIPKLGVTERLLEGIRLPTFDRGAGHWPGSAMPGQFGNAVVGGHRTSASRPFRDLDTLVAGDQVIFDVAEGRVVYRVVSVEIISPDDLSVVAQNPGFNATLFACHPPGSTDERIVAHLTLEA